MSIRSSSHTELVAVPGGMVALLSRGFPAPYHLGVTALLGFSAFIALALVVAIALYVGSVVREALRPPRVTAAWAIARGKPSCPADLGLLAEEWQLDVPSGRGGLRLPVWDIDLGDDTGDTTVLFVHGWGRSRIDSLGRIGPFLEGVRRLLLVDLRGHGDAEGRTTLGDGDERDLARLIERVPDGPVILVGHSLGATVAIRCAALPEVTHRVAGVVAIAPYDTMTTPLGTRLAVRDLPRGPLLGMVIAVLRGLGIRAVSTLDAARALRAPLTVLHGDSDRISPVAEGRAIADAARGSFVLFEDVEHADHEARRPELFRDACRALLARSLDRNGIANETGRAS